MDLLFGFGFMFHPLFAVRFIDDVVGVHSRYDTGMAKFGAGLTSKIPLPTGHGGCLVGK